jgi:hypothetical protein
MKMAHKYVCLGGSSLKEEYDKENSNCVVGNTYGMNEKNLNCVVGNTYGVINEPNIILGSCANEENKLNYLPFLIVGLFILKAIKFDSLKAL